MRKTIPFLFLLLLALSAMAQKHCISGYVMDAASRETLIGATVIDRNTGRGCGRFPFAYGKLGFAVGRRAESIGIYAACCGELHAHDWWRALFRWPVCQLDSGRQFVGE